MPNWCANRLSVIGKRSKLARFKRETDHHFAVTNYECEVDKEAVEQTSQERLIRDSIVTPLVAEKVSESDFGLLPNVLVNLATEYMTNDDALLSFRMQSRWQPMSDLAFCQLAQRYPDLLLHLIYAEQGMQFVGEKWAFDGALDVSSTYERKVDGRDLLPRTQRNRDEDDEEGDEDMDEDDDAIRYRGPFAELLHESG